MVSESALDRIVSLLALKAGERVLEVGAGLGFLTERLAATGAELTAVEKDKRFCIYLREKFAGQPNVHIHEGDILEFDFKKYLAGGRAKCVGNVPYQISSPLIEVVQNVGPSWDDVLFTFQKDFALRMVAPAGAEDRSSLGAWLELHAQVGTVHQFKKNDFDPSPRIDSSLARIRFLSKPLCSSADAAIIRAAIRAGFQKRRKSMLNALSMPPLSLPKDQVRSALASANIPESTRAADLTAQNWLALGSALNKA